jgi:dTDP-4-amino-4,6-dideoxygalactose transaminase
MSRVHLSLPDVGIREYEAVSRAMTSGWIAPLGPEVDAFEQEMASRVGCAHAVALSSGTSALHLGLLAAGVGPGDIVPTSTMTFAATANAIAYTGATPYFVDCELDTGNIDPALLADAVASISAKGKRIGAIVPVDIYGKVADFERISAAAAERGIPIVSDSAESVGSRRGGREAGAFGLVSAFSFNGNKIMTTSGGGMLTTNDATAADLVRRLSTQARQPVPYYLHTEIGYNYRLSNILAALGRAQLARLDEMIARRRAIRHRYREVVEASGVATILGGDHDDDDNCWLTSIVLEGDGPVTVETVAREFDVADIETRRLWNPMHRQPVFRNSPRLVNGTADSLFARGLTLPSGSSMTDSQVDRVSSILGAALKGRHVPA